MATLHPRDMPPPGAAGAESAAAASRPNVQGTANAARALAKLGATSDAFSAAASTASPQRVYICIRYLYIYI